MEKKDNRDKKDIYMLVLTGLFYLYLWGKNVVVAVSYVSGWDWLAFIVLAIIALVICGFAWLFSCVLVTETIKYFGLQKSYLVITILSIIIAPLMILFLLLVLSGVIPSIFDPRFL
jgi:hypothetical protein